MSEYTKLIEAELERSYWRLSEAAYLSTAKAATAIRRVLARCDAIEAEAATKPGMEIIGKSIAEEFRREIAVGLLLTEE